MAKSAIEWTESTWNPLTGCDKISPGCKHCYAERMALRLQAMGPDKYARGFSLAILRLAGPVPVLPGFAAPMRHFRVCNNVAGTCAVKS